MQTNATRGLASGWPTQLSTPAQRKPGERALLPYWRDWLLLALLLLAIFGAFIYRLNTVLISDMDEGTYLYAGKLVAQGMLPYRDFLLAHPPLLVLLAAAWERVVGAEIMPARLAYLSLVLVSTLPLYAISRRLFRSGPVGLLSVATYMSGMLLLANMGRTVRLEPVMDAFLIAGFACYAARSNSLKLRLLMGVLFAAATLVKLVAVVPVGLLFLGDLLWSPRDRAWLRLWATSLAGFVVILVPSAVALISQPNFVDEVIVSQITRGGLPVQLRASYLWQDFVRFPPIPVGLAAAAWQLVRARDTRLRILALVALGGTLSLVFLFQTFFGYYLVQMLPWLAVLFAATCQAVARRITVHWRAALVLLAITLTGPVPLAYAEFYSRSGHEHVASAAPIVPLLKGGQGYMYSMYPAFALWSDRTAYPWTYAADSLIPRITGRLSDEQFIEAFANCQDLVLYTGELDAYPKADAYVKAHFTSKLANADYQLWSRS